MALLFACRERCSLQGGCPQSGAGGWRPPRRAMKALLPRHKWAISRISEGVHVPHALAEEFLAVPENLAIFEHLCAAEPTSPLRVYVFYQPPDEQMDTGDMVEAKLPTGQAAEKVLFFCSGEESTRLHGGCVYFVRMCETGNPVDLTVANDEDLLCGGIDAEPLRGLEVALSQVYAPVLDTVKPWGRADEAHVEEFRADLDRLSGECLRHALTRTSH